MQFIWLFQGMVFWLDMRDKTRVCSLSVSQVSINGTRPVPQLKFRSLQPHNPHTYPLTLQSR